MRRVSWSVVFSCIAAVALLCAVGCGDKSSYDKPDAAAVEPTEAVESAEPAHLEVGEEAVMLLARADVVDGHEDHVVSNCVGCALAMEGKAEQVVHVGDYEMHFCSDHCREAFEKDAEGALMAVEWPDEEATEATP